MLLGGHVPAQVVLLPDRREQATNGQEPAAHVLLHAGGQHGAQQVGFSEVNLDQTRPGVEWTRDVLGLRRLAGPVRHHPVDAVQLRQAGQPLVPVPRLR